MLGLVPGAAAGESEERLSQAWRDFGANECGAYSPLYAAICRSVADDPELLALAAAAPPSGQQPNVLLAAVHYLVLGGLAHPLAEIYAGRADPGPAPALFRDVCLAHRPTVSRILATRHTQTNEPGRAALLAVGLAAAADRLGEPVGLLDAGRGRRAQSGRGCLRAAMAGSGPLEEFMAPARAPRAGVCVSEEDTCLELSSPTGRSPCSSSWRSWGCRCG